MQNNGMRNSGLRENGAASGFVPAWPIPATVGSFVTCRGGGHSAEPYRSNNLGTHVGDDPGMVARNRRQLARQLGISQPCWLRQVHGTEIVEAAGWADPPTADASFSSQPGRVCAVLTADCLPLLLCDCHGEQVAAVHCGWRGLAGGIVARAVATFRSQPGDLLAYLGPAISAKHYEVSGQVRDALAITIPPDSSLGERTFSEPLQAKPGHFLVDLYDVARAQLVACGVSHVYGGDRCTFAEADTFYSYRRDGVTGRMASLIWRRDLHTGT